MRIGRLSAALLMALSTISACDAAPVAPPAGLTIRPLGMEALEMLLAWDSERSGLQRRAILCHLRERQPGMAFAAERAGKPVGFVLGR